MTARCIECKRLRPLHKLIYFSISDHDTRIGAYECRDKSDGCIFTKFVPKEDADKT